MSPERGWMNQDKNKGWKITGKGGGWIFGYVLPQRITVANRGVTKKWRTMFFLHSGSYGWNAKGSTMCERREGGRKRMNRGRTDRSAPQRGAAKRYCSLQTLELNRWLNAGYIPYNNQAVSWGTRVEPQLICLGQHLRAKCGVSAGGNILVHPKRPANGSQEGSTIEKMVRSKSRKGMDRGCLGWRVVTGTGLGWTTHNKSWRRTIELGPLSSAWGPWNCAPLGERNPPKGGLRGS